jgi:hypothetical protein
MTADQTHVEDMSWVFVRSDIRQRTSVDPTLNARESVPDGQKPIRDRAIVLGQRENEQVEEDSTRQEPNHVRRTHHTVSPRVKL